jgi:hypothetical protein
VASRVLCYQARALPTRPLFASREPPLPMRLMDVGFGEIYVLELADWLWPASGRLADARQGQDFVTTCQHPWATWHKIVARAISAL